MSRCVVSKRFPTFPKIVLLSFSESSSQKKLHFLGKLGTRKCPNSCTDSGALWILNDKDGTTCQNKTGTPVFSGEKTDDKMHMMMMTTKAT